MDWIEADKQKPHCSKPHGESDYVLCSADFGSQFVGWYNEREDAWYVSNYGSNGGSLPSYSNPSHWMPLPKPPIAG